LQIVQIWKSIKTTIEQFAAERDLTLQQIFVLYQLYHEDRILMNTLAKHLHCDASNITGMADRLQSLGLIDRRELPEDRRAKQLVITAEGRGLIDTLIPRLPHCLGLHQMTSSEITELRRLLDKVLI
jgi:DNA-binding MarR family transcriptional regulator